MSELPQNSLEKTPEQPKINPIEQMILASRETVQNRVLFSPEPTTGPEKVGVLNEAIQALATEMRALSYDEYRLLDGMLKNIRSNKPNTAEDSTPRIQSILSYVQTLQVNSGLPSDKCAEDCILLLRTTYPVGKNIANVKADPKLPMGFNAKVPLDVVCSRTFFTITPSGISNVLVVLDNAPHTLKPGQSIRVGRDLRSGKLFGMTLQEPVGVDVKAQVQGDPGFSRGGLMVTLSSDGTEVYVFDCASSAEVICRQGEREVSYNPSVKSQDGKGYGASEYKE